MFSTQVKYHQHNCARCIFLGNYSNEAEDYDLYFHLGKLFGGSLIARYGEGAEYISVPYTSYLANKEDIDATHPAIKIANDHWNEYKGS